MKTRIWMLLVVMAVFAVPTFGQQDQREVAIDDGGDGDGGAGGGEIVTGSYDLGRYLDNPCTAVSDLVNVGYEVYLYQESITSAIGTGRYIFEEDTTMNGMYATKGSTQSDVSYMDQPFTLRQYHKVNTPDDFHVVTVIDYDPASKQSYVSTETACGNGMPDSKQ